MHRLLFTVAVILALLLTPVWGWAQGLTAEQVLARSFEALGGQENLRKVKTRVVTGQAEVLGGFLGSYKSWAKTPNNLKTKWDIQIIQQERGFDGANGWEKQASLRELTGRYLARIKRDALFNPLLTYSDEHVPMNLKGKEPVAGRTAYVIQVVPLDSPVERFYFDDQTFLPVMSCRLVPYAEGNVPITVTYADYRKVGDVVLPFSIQENTLDVPLAITVEKYLLNVPLDDDAFGNPLAKYAAEPYEVSLATIPKHVYKESDAHWTQAFEEGGLETNGTPQNRSMATGWQRFWGIPFGPTETWFFNVVVNEKYGRQLKPISATLEYYSGQRSIRTQNISQEELKTTEKFPVSRFAPQPEIFDYRYYESAPTSLDIDRIVYTLKVQTGAGRELQESLEIPLAHYQPKHKLIFPIKGKFVALGGHEFYEVGHTYEWSQHYAYDIVGLGPNLELARNDARIPQDFYGWGVEVLAPADGEVTYARNDVPNMMPLRDFLKLPEPEWAICGNAVVIDHGEGEVSFFCHMQYGFVRVKRGDRVKQNQVIGLMGCSGAPGDTHLHYQLQAGTGFFNSDGLPSQFENLELMFSDGMKALSPKRGVYMEAK
jgi:hypothetical protein